MRLEGAFRNHRTDFLKIDPQCDAQSLESVDGKERDSVRSTLEIKPRTPTVKLNWIMLPMESQKAGDETG
jgi:hypothetical protein